MSILFISCVEVLVFIPVRPNVFRLNGNLSHFLKNPMKMLVKCNKSLFFNSYHICHFCVTNAFLGYITEFSFINSCSGLRDSTGSQKELRKFQKIFLF
jgi:hypothetical protein